MAREREDTTKHTLHFFRGDVERLRVLYPETGASLIIRTLVRRHIERIEAAATPSEQLKLDIEL